VPVFNLLNCDERESNKSSDRGFDLFSSLMLGYANDLEIFDQTAVLFRSQRDTFLRAECAKFNDSVIDWKYLRANQYILRK